jgi:sigma-B regulation protein RsbU (phosphoserine phosphatase)
MGRQGGHFFTIWYGVFDSAARKLTFSGGGHPPAILFGGSSAADARVQQLEGDGPPIGVTDILPFVNCTVELPAFARLVLYSDGAVEVGDPEGTMYAQADFDAFMAETGPVDAILDRTLERARTLSGGDVLNDDCSVMRVDFV